MNPALVPQPVPPAAAPAWALVPGLF
jgi:hypothetical protein